MVKSYISLRTLSCDFFFCRNFISVLFFFSSFVRLFVFFFGLEKNTASWKATEFPPHQSIGTQTPPSLSPADGTPIQSASTPLLSIPRPWPISSEQLGGCMGSTSPSPSCLAANWLLLHAVSLQLLGLVLAKGGGGGS